MMLQKEEMKTQKMNKAITCNANRVKMQDGISFAEQAYSLKS